GHLYPGIAVAREIQRLRPGTVVTFAGTARGIEARVVPREGFELDVIRSGGLKGKSIAVRLKGVALLPLSAVDAWRLLSKRRPRLGVGVGGVRSGPRGAPAAAARDSARAPSSPSRRCVAFPRCSSSRTLSRA